MEEELKDGRGKRRERGLRKAKVGQVKGFNEKSGTSAIKDSGARARADLTVMGDAMVSAGGILEKDIAALLASMEPAAPVELTVEQEMQRRATMHELDFLFGGLDSLARGKGSPPRFRRPVETAEARARREELLYESVIRIFELQLKQERREAESRRRQGKSSSSVVVVGKAPPSAPTAATSSMLPKLPSLGFFTSARSKYT